MIPSNQAWQQLFQSDSSHLIDEMEEIDEVVLYRASNYAKLGFDYEDCFKLAGSCDKDGFNLYWGDVNKLLEKGATHRQIVAIFT